MAYTSASAFYPQVSYSPWQPIESTGYERPFVYNGDERDLQAYIAGPPILYQVTDEEFAHDDAIDPEPSSGQVPAPKSAPPPSIEIQSPQSPPTSPRSEVRFALGTAPPAPVSPKVKKGILKPKKSTVFVPPSETEEEKNARLERIASMRQESEEKAKLLAIEKAARKEREKQVKLDAAEAAKSLEAEKAAKRKERMEKEKEEKARKAEQDKLERIAKKEAAEALKLAKAEKARIKKEKQDEEKKAKEAVAAAAAVAKQEKAAEIAAPEEAGPSSSNLSMPSQKDSEVKSAKNNKKDTKKDKRKDKAGKGKGKSAAMPAVPPPPPVPDPPSEAAPPNDLVTAHNSEPVKQSPMETPLTSSEDSSVLVEEIVLPPQQDIAEGTSSLIDNVPTPEDTPIPEDTPTSEDTPTPEEVPEQCQTESKGEQDIEITVLEEVSQSGEIIAIKSSDIPSESLEPQPAHDDTISQPEHQTPAEISAEISSPTPGGVSLEGTSIDDLEVASGDQKEEEGHSSDTLPDDSTRPLLIEDQQCKDDVERVNGDSQEQDHVDISPATQQSGGLVMPITSSEEGNNSPPQDADTDIGIVSKGSSADLPPPSTIDNVMSLEGDEDKETVLSQECESQAVEAPKIEESLDAEETQIPFEADACPAELVSEDQSPSIEEQPTSVKEEISKSKEETVFIEDQSPSAETQVLSSDDNACLDDPASPNPECDKSSCSTVETTSQPTLPLEKDPEPERVQDTPVSSSPDDAKTSEVTTVSEALDRDEGTVLTADSLDTESVKCQTVETPDMVEPVLQTSLGNMPQQSLMNESEELQDDENPTDESLIGDETPKTGEISGNEQPSQIICEETFISSAEVTSDLPSEEQCSEIISEQIADLENEDVNTSQISASDTPNTSDNSVTDVIDIASDQPTCFHNDNEGDDEALDEIPSSLDSSNSKSHEHGLLVEAIDQEQGLALGTTVTEESGSSSEQLVIQAVDEDSPSDDIFRNVASSDGAHNSEYGEVDPGPELPSTDEVIDDGTIIDPESLEPTFCQNVASQTPGSVPGNINLDSSAICFSEPGDLQQEASPDFTETATSTHPETLPNSSTEQADEILCTEVSEIPHALGTPESVEEFTILPDDGGSLLSSTEIYETEVDLEAPSEKTVPSNEIPLTVNDSETLVLESNDVHENTPLGSDTAMNTDIDDRRDIDPVLAPTQRLRSVEGSEISLEDTHSQMKDDYSAIIELDIPPEALISSEPATMLAISSGEDEEEVPPAMSSTSTGNVSDNVPSIIQNSTSDGASLLLSEESCSAIDITDMNESTKNCGQLESGSINDHLEHTAVPVLVEGSCTEIGDSVILNDQETTNVPSDTTLGVITDSHKIPRQLLISQSDSEDLTEVDDKTIEDSQESNISCTNNVSSPDGGSSLCQTSRNEEVGSIEFVDNGSEEGSTLETTSESPQQAPSETSMSLHESGQVLSPVSSLTQEVLQEPELDISQSVISSSGEVQEHSADVDVTTTTDSVILQNTVISATISQDEPESNISSNSPPSEHSVVGTTQEAISSKLAEDHIQEPTEEISDHLVEGVIMSPAVIHEPTSDGETPSVPSVELQSPESEPSQFSITERSILENSLDIFTSAEIVVESADAAPVTEAELAEGETMIVENVTSSTDVQASSLLCSQTQDDAAPVQKEDSRPEDHSETVQLADQVPQIEKLDCSSSSAQDTSFITGKNVIEEIPPLPKSLTVEDIVATDKKVIDVQALEPVHEHATIQDDEIVHGSVEQTQPVIEQVQILDKTIVEEPEQMTPDKEKEPMSSTSPTSHKRRHRSSRHSSHRHSSSRDLAMPLPSNSNEPPSTNRSRRLSESGGSLKALWSGLTAPRQGSPPALQKPTRVDSGVDTGSTSSHGHHRKRRSTLDGKLPSEDVKVVEPEGPERNSRGRTVEEQEAHDKRKAERRASRALEKERADVVVPAPVLPSDDNKTKRLSRRRQSISQHVINRDDSKRVDIHEIEKESVVKSPTFLASGDAMVKETKDVAFASSPAVIDHVVSGEAVITSRSVDTKPGERTRKHSERPKLDDKERRSSRRHPSSSSSHTHSHSHTSRVDRSLPSKEQEITEKLDPERQARRLRRDEDKRLVAERFKVEKEARLAKEKEEADRIVRRAERRRKRAEEEKRLQEEQQQQQEKGRLEAEQKRKEKEENNNAERLAFDLSKDKDRERRREGQGRGEDAPRERGERIHRNSMRRNKESQREKEKEKKGGLSSLWRGARKAFA